MCQHDTESCAFGRKKKLKKKPVPYTHQDVISFRRHFTAFDGKKGDTGAAALYGGKCKRTVQSSWQTDRPWLLVKRR